MKARIEGLKAQGYGVYEDSKGRIYAGSRKSRTLYAVSKEKQKQLSFYQQRHLVPLILLVTVGFYLNWYLAVGLSLGSILILEYLYSQVFLKSLVKYEDIDIPEEPTLVEKVAGLSRKNVIAILAMSAVLAVLLIVNMIGTVSSGDLSADPGNLIFLAVSSALFVYALRYIRASFLALKQLKQ